MTQNLQWLAVASVLAGLLACSSGGTTNGLGPVDASGILHDVAVGSDVQTPSDVATDVAIPGTDTSPVGTDVVASTDSGIDAGIDAGSDAGPDAGPADALEDADVPEDLGPPMGPCLPSAVVNLTTAGTHSGPTTRYTGNNNSASADPVLIPTCNAAPDHPVALAYTVHATSHLRVSTVDPGTTFDTVVWALDACAAGGTELGCNDDNSAGAAPTTASEFVTDQAIAAGDTVYILVGGNGSAHGTFVLTVIELPEVAVGGACDPTGASNVCTAGSTCTTTGTTSVCVATRVTYTETVIASPTWVDACATGTHVVLVGGLGPDTAREDNHAMSPATIPFAFSLFGVTQNLVWADTSGYAQFGMVLPDDEGGADSIPSNLDGPLVAAFWNDLLLPDPVPPSTAENLCTSTVGTAPNRVFVIEWLNAQASGFTDTTLTFEAVLHETTSAVDIVYNTLTSGPSDSSQVNGSTASVGLQDDMGADSIAHSGLVSTATGIRFTPM